MALYVAAFVVMAILIAVVVWLVVKLGPLPGRIAKDRGHPQADAIMVLGWIGVITLGLVWPVALVWAYARPWDEQTRHLSERVGRLESEFAALRAAGEDA